MRRKCPATSPLLLLQLLLRCSEQGGGVNFGEKDAKVSRAWRDGVRVPGEGTSWDSDRASPELRYGIGDVISNMNHHFCLIGLPEPQAQLDERRHL
uniref:Secreted protein n=1 Tax=Cercocebus atys TaxID=9531 RepID=A0A2K5NQL2_CERAT